MFRAKADKGTITTTEQAAVTNIAYTQWGQHPNTQISCVFEFVKLMQKMVKFMLMLQNM